MKRVFIGVIAAVLMVGGLIFIHDGSVAAVDVFEACNDLSASERNANPVCSSTGDDVGDLIANIISLLLLLIGIVSVIMIIIGGFRYITAQGDSGQLSTAKNTIMYAVVGLVVALAAYAIVAFVISSI